MTIADVDKGPPDVARALLDRHARALERRAVWEPLWRDCYEHGLPHSAAFTQGAGPGQRRGERLFDATAADAVDQLAAALLGQLTPPWSRWAGLDPGPALAADLRDRIAPLLDQTAAVLQGQIDRSNFAVEAHQAYLDVVTGGTGCLLVEEAPPGAAAALRFTAVPLADLVLEEGEQGRLDRLFRRVPLTLEGLVARFGLDTLPDWLRQAGADDPQRRFACVEVVEPQSGGGGWRWQVVLDGDEGPLLLSDGQFTDMPFIAFRWLKAPGETYGRSPVMKALPDIKTANKVVELVLKNASIAVTGIWQADDDGVLNPAAVRLVPGAIIPKAVGSAGLTPLSSPGRFDISQLVLDDLRARIRHALLADRLAPLDSPRMTATEVLERSAEMTRLLGATFGRLQSELLVPLVRRCLAILRRRGLVPDIAVDGRNVAIRILSPLARAQAQRDAEVTLRWLESVSALGADALAIADLPACARFLADAAGVPPGLLRQMVPSAMPGDADG
jgi:hypothetical protein